MWLIWLSLMKEQHMNPLVSLSVRILSKESNQRFLSWQDDADGDRNQSKMLLFQVKCVLNVKTGLHSNYM